MNVLPLGLAVGLLAFLVVSTCSVPVVLVLRRCGAGRSASGLLALRLAPTLLALAVVFGLMVPAFLLHEPHESDETVGGPLALLATVAGVQVCAGVWRGLRALRATRRLQRDWFRVAHPVRVPDLDMPAHVIDSAFPVVALVGLRRPRLFVAANVMQALDAAELSAVIAHERAHLRAGDTLRALLWRACPDLLDAFPSGRRLQRDWSQATEEAADDAAVAGQPRRALDLAGALLKLGRLTPQDMRLPTLAVALQGDDEAGLSLRVARLLRQADGREAAGVARRARVTRHLLAFTSAAGTVLAVSVAVLAQPLLLVHELIEHTVRTLG